MSTFSVTALQLVNRVRERRRLAPVGGFSETEDMAALNAINTAMEDVFSEQKWQFNKRSDGQLAIKGKFAVNGLNFIDGFTSITVSNTTLAESDLIGDHVMRILPESHTTLSNTAIRANSASPPAVNTSIATIPFQLSATQIGVTGQLLYSEYLLPDTVEELIRGRYQEHPLTLLQVEPELSYDEIFPRPHIEFGPPEVIAVGGYDRPTYTTGTDPLPPPQLRLAVWPVPDQDFVIDYSYYYRHPDLETITDTLDGVPPNVVSRIVDFAAADMKTFYEKDPEGLRIRLSLEGRTDRAHQSHGASRSRRKTLSSFDSSSIGGHRIHRGFPGRVLG